MQRPHEVYPIAGEFYDSDFRTIAHENDGDDIFRCKSSGVSLDDKHSFTELPPRCPEHQFNFTLLQEKFSKSECKKLDKRTIVLISDWMKTKIW